MSLIRALSFSDSFIYPLRIVLCKLKGFRVFSFVFFLLSTSGMFGQTSSNELSCENIHKILIDTREKLVAKEENKILAKVDSLLKLNANCDNVKIESLIIKGIFGKLKGDLESAMNTLVEARNMSKSHQYYQKLISHVISDVHEKNVEYKKAIALLDSVYALPCESQIFNCGKENVALLAAKGRNLRTVGDSESAIESFKIANKVMMDTSVFDSMTQASIYNQMGHIYKKDFGDHRTSMEYYKNASSILPSNKSYNKYGAYNNIGFAYVNLLEFDSARMYFNKTINSDIGARYRIVANQGMAAISVREEDYDKGIYFYKKALEHSKTVNRKNNIFSNQIFLAKAYFLNEDFLESQTILDEIEKTNTSNLSKSIKWQLGLYNHLNAVGVMDAKLSKVLYKDFLVNDTLMLDARTRIIDKSVSKYEKLLLRDSLERQVLLQENEAEKVKNYRLSTILLLLGLLFLGGLVYQFRNLFVSQKKVNEELVFQNQDLTEINQQLKQRNESLNMKAGDALTTFIQYESNHNSVKLEAHRVKYLQAEDQGIRVYYDEASNWTDMPLKTLQAQLPDDQFLLIFRGTVVNINFVERVNSTSLKLKDGTELRISRLYKSKIKEVFMNL